MLCMGVEPPLDWQDSGALIIFLPRKRECVWVADNQEDCTSRVAQTVLDLMKAGF